MSGWQNATTIFYRNTYNLTFKISSKAKFIAYAGNQHIPGTHFTLSGIAANGIYGFILCAIDASHLIVIPPVIAGNAA